MIELIFVIVIMGILAKFGTELFLKIYNGYTTTAWATSANEKTMNAIQEIANRLRERIPESVEVTGGGSGVRWIGRDVDGWNNGRWSGVADIAPNTDSNATLIETPGTDASYFSTANDYAVYFLQNDDIPGSATFYTANGSMFKVSGFDTSGSRNAFVFSNSLSRASEFYVAAEYAYSLAFNSATKTLSLSRWKPWNNGAVETFTLADGIDLFTVKNAQGNAGGFLVTLCQKTKMVFDQNNTIGEYRICKQKFIF